MANLGFKQNKTELAAEPEITQFLKQLNICISVVI